MSPHHPVGVATYEWWEWHDTYGGGVPSRWFGEPDPGDPNDPRPARGE